MFFQIKQRNGSLHKIYKLNKSNNPESFLPNTPYRKYLKIEVLSQQTVSIDAE